MIQPTQTQTIHHHEYEDDGGILRCSCGKTKLILKATKQEGIFTGVKSNGVNYSVRKDRHRYFFPNEWISFMNKLKPSKQLLFETLLQSGARIEEAINIRPKDFDFERNTLTLFVTKSKAKKGQNKEMGGTKRGFVVSSEYARKMKKLIKEKGMEENSDAKIFPITRQAAWRLMRRNLIAAGIKDYYNFSLHNIRKTSGMWLKTLIPFSREITEGEICMRLGHDMNTFLKHYGSPSIFNERDKIAMTKIMGDIYGLK
jgi:integrase